MEAMEQLHAPWRIEYILAPKMPAGDGTVSVFKQIAESADDEANLVVLRARTCYVLLNKHPYNGGHLMVVPYRQVAGLEDLTEEEMLEISGVGPSKMERFGEAFLGVIREFEG